MVFAMGVCQFPIIRSLLKMTCRYFGVEMNERGDAIIASDFLKIALNFWTCRVIGIPFGIGREAICVSMGWHIAGKPRITIVPPCPPETIGFFKDHKFTFGFF